jgi:recombinational DNA repair ATPase RecF
MWLKSLTIRNLRSIENIAVSFDQRTNVIVGPNAVGKTTLLEGIRLAKATLAPRIPDETQQAFMSYEHPGIRPKELRGKSYRDIGNFLFVR